MDRRSVTAASVNARARRWGLVTLGVAFVLLCVGLSGPYFPERFSDARAFYCGGRAVLAHADPYREHPLLECERSVAAPALSPLRDDVAVPAPFPGFALALFALPALLPFALALLVWMLAASSAVVAATVLVARVTRTPLSAATIAIAYPAVTVALPLGQITPFVLLAIAAAGALLVMQRPRCAALAALGALLEPHVGLALVAGLAVAVPRTRTVLAAGIAGVAAIGCAISGVANQREYLQLVLPAHALANVPDALQFSTTHFAYIAGAPVALALALGTVWYVVAVGVGICVAVALRGRLGPAAVAFIPVAFAVFGGTHTHLAQLGLATPAFLLVCATARGNVRRACVILTFIAATPWLGLAPFPLLFAATALVALIFARRMGVREQALRLAAATFIALGALFIALARSHAPHRAIDARVEGNPLAQVAWQIFVLARNSPPEYWYLVAKAPTVIAFAGLLVGLTYVALRPRPTVPGC